MENIKKLYKATNLKYQFLRGMINLNCLMDYVPYLIFKIILSKSIRMYVNKIENRITFKIKTGYYPELLRPETMKLLGVPKMG